MIRVGLVTKNGTPKGENFLTREEADNYVISVAEKEGIKKYKIINIESREILDEGKDL